MNQNQFLVQLKNIKNPKQLANFVLDPSPRKIEFLISHPSLRKVIIKISEKIINRSLPKDKRLPKQVQIDKFSASKALIRSVNRLLDRTQNHPQYKDALIHSFLPCFLQSIKESSEKHQVFSKKYGFNPPWFLTISPTRFCNLKCTGCYANSSIANREKLSFETVDKIVSEKTDLWGSFFCVISGGEPFLWKDKGKTIIDLAKKHQDNLFLVYTNGTLINKETARKLAKVGNITPAISVEGFEKETDERRGKGTFKKIHQAMDNLNEFGVPFGISVTPTRKNCLLLTSEEFIKYFWTKGALYAWMFQLMPIGRASFDLVITPEQRKEMFYRTRDLIKKGYFVADFWNCGALTEGCISAGRKGGYLYIDWNGNISPCVFNPYAVANINEIYQKGGQLTDVLTKPFLERIRKWQDDYAAKQGNWTLPCPIRDHYKEMRKFIDKYEPQPIDEPAKQALEDKEYRRKMINYDKNLAEVMDPIWEKEYKKSKKAKA